MEPVGDVEDEEDEWEDDGRLLVPVDLLKVFIFESFSYESFLMERQWLPLLVPFDLLKVVFLKVMKVFLLKGDGHLLVPVDLLKVLP